MKLQKHKFYYKFILTILWLMGGLITNKSVSAQLTPDNTLGAESSVITKVNEVKDIIHGGATRGANLFHSFQEFNIGVGKSVYFDNPTGIENILTRVTGGNVSNILGTLGVEGTANLFLINPNGIYFGNGARLDIQGSFTATTADGIRLGENGLFSASNPQSSNLLTVQPGALFRNAIRNQQAEIRNEGNLQVKENQNITFFGANVLNTGTLTAPGGTVQLTGTETLKVRGNIGTGTLLLDTKNLTIGENNNATINKTTLEGLSGNTNLIFQATDDITINPLSDKSLNLFSGGGEIKFTADVDGNGIGNFQMNIADTIKTNGRNISISGANLILGNIDTSFVTGGKIISVDVDNGGAIPPSATKATATFTFTVLEKEIIEDLDVKFSAAHTWDEDLTVSLTSPSGTTLQLFSGVGGRGDNFQDTLLNDSAATSIKSGSPPFKGEFKPTGAGGLAIFNNENTVGTWKLQVTDNYIWQDNGTLYKAGNTAPWGIADGTKLIFRTPPVPGNSGAIALNATKGNINVGKINAESVTGNGGEVNLSATENINLNGSLAAVNRINILADADNNGMGNFQMNTADTIKTNGGNISITGTNLIVGNIDTSNPFVKGGDIIAVVDVDNGGAIPPSVNQATATFTFTVLEEQTIGDLDVQFSAAHTWNSDLAVSLTSPSGSTLQLFNGVGGRGDNFQDTLLNDSAANSINNASSPFKGEFKPMGAGGLAIFNGENPQGTWQLQVTDNYIWEDNGTLYKAGDTAPWGIADGTKLIFRTPLVPGNSGAIALNATKGNINVGKINAESVTGNGGEVNLSATENINLNGSLAAANNIKVLADTDGNGNGNFQMNTANTIKTSGRNVEIKGVSLTLGNIDTSLSFSGKVGNGGDITAIAENNIITNGTIVASGGVNSSSGNITLTSKNGEIVLSKTYVISNSDGVSKGGDINITGRSIFATNDSIIAATTFGEGDAGLVKITSTDNIKIDDNILIFSAVRPGALGEALGVDISTKSLELLNGSIISSNTFGAGNAGTVKITATDTIKIDGHSRVGSQVASESAGKAGDVSITTKYLEILGGSEVSSSTFGEGDAGSIIINVDSLKATNAVSIEATDFGIGKGNAGSIIINASDIVKFERSGVYSRVVTGAVGNGGDVSITTKFLEVNDSLINATSAGKGNAGKVTIITDFLEVTNGGQIVAVTAGEGNTGTGGSVNINATNFVKFDGLGNGFSSGAFSAVASKAVGNGGDVFINTKSLEVTNGAQISAGSSGKGNAGSVIINATDFVKFDGLRNGFSSGAFSDVSSEGVGEGGDIYITTSFLEVTNGAQIGASIVGIGNAGDIIITTRFLEVTNGAQIGAGSFGQGDAGSVIINATDFAKFDGFSLSSGSFSGVFSSVESGAVGKAGNVSITTASLEITNGAALSASTSSSGQAGNILLNTDTLTVASGGEILAFTSGNGDGGTIIINADKAVNMGIGVQDFAPILSVETSGTGKAGDIFINTPTLTLSDTARITATATATATNTEGGGSITLNASKMDLAGVVGIFAETQGEAPAGTLQLNPYQNQPDLDITLFPNSTISASTTAAGKGGDLIITAPENINIAGQGKLAVESTGTGDAGNISISTQNLNITDGVKISASTINSGKGGNINLNANKFNATNGAQFLTTTSGSAQAGNINLIVKDNITLDGKNTGLFANTEIGSTGKSGSITIDPQTFIIRNGAGIGVNSQGSGEGGDISVQAGLLSLNNQAFISAETASNQGGNINLAINDLLLLRNNSRISATAGTDQAGGNGGNITINAPFIVAFPSENSDITANAFEGNGGNINITTNALFGIEFRPQETQRSDITASSEFGIAGNVQINRPDVDPTSGLLELPGNLVDAESLNKDVCAIKDDKIAGGSSFIITGKGGLPADTDELISHSLAYLEWENNPETVTESKPVNAKVTQEKKNDVPEIQEAQGWIITPDGKVILTANAKKVTLQSNKNNLPNCK
jgi:filamentous hemagglutinin family protein